MKTIGDRPLMKDIERHLTILSANPRVSPHLKNLSGSLWRSRRSSKELVFINSKLIIMIDKSSAKPSKSDSVGVQTWHY